MPDESFQIRCRDMNLNPIEVDRHWKPIFDKYDTNKDGIIPFYILKNALNSHNTLRHDFPDEVLDEILEWADIEEDGLLSYSGFLQMVHAYEVGKAHPTVKKIVHFAALVAVPKSQHAITVRWYIEKCNCFPPPMFMLFMSLIQLVTYFYYCMDLEEFSATGPIPWKSESIFDPEWKIQIWRFVTYMFVPAGFVHVFFNLLVQLLLGLPLEMVHKWWRVMLVYLGGVLAGSLACSQYDRNMYLAGASGGVCALMGAHLVNVIINFKEMAFGCVRLIAFLIFAGSDVGVALYARYTPDETNHTSYAAHFAGALAGLMTGSVYFRNLKVHKWERKICSILYEIFVFLVIFHILLNILDFMLFIAYFRQP